MREETGGGREEVEVVERNACVSLEGRIGDLKCAGASDLGVGMGLGLGNEVIFCHRSSPFESLDVTRTHLEVKRLGKKKS